MATMKNIRPAWYMPEDDTAWEKVKAAFRRDWQQSKRDFGGNEPNLSQNTGITAARATGSKPISTAKTPASHPAVNSTSDYNEDHEPAYRYGYAASRQYGSSNDWDDQTESILRKDWDDETEWERHREAVRRGFLYGKLQRRLTTR